MIDNGIFFLVGLLFGFWKNGKEMMWCTGSLVKRRVQSSGRFSFFSMTLLFFARRWRQIWRLWTVREELLTVRSRQFFRRPQRTKQLLDSAPHSLDAVSKCVPIETVIEMSMFSGPYLWRGQEGGGEEMGKQHGKALQWLRSALWRALQNLLRNAVGSTIPGMSLTGEEAGSQICGRELSSIASPPHHPQNMLILVCHYLLCDDIWSWAGWKTRISRETYTTGKPTRAVLVFLRMYLSSNCHSFRVRCHNDIVSLDLKFLVTVLKWNHLKYMTISVVFPLILNFNRSLYSRDFVVISFGCSIVIGDCEKAAFHVALWKTRAHSRGKSTLSRLFGKLFLLLSSSFIFFHRTDDILSSHLLASAKIATPWVKNCDKRGIFTS